MILLGQPELKTKVEALAQLSQRIVIRYHLMPFSGEEVGEYVDFRMQAAGASRMVFTPEAMQVIAEVSGGVPPQGAALSGVAVVHGFSGGLRRELAWGVKKALL